MSLCFASGAVLSGANIILANQNKDFERMKTFTTAMDNQLVNDFDSLSKAEQDYALEILMAPLAGLGAGSVLKSFVPNAKFMSFINKSKSSMALKGSKSVNSSGDELSETGASLQRDVAKVRSEYKSAEDVNVCGINVGSYMCRDNVQELLRYAQTKYSDFDLSKARVIKIEAPEYVPLFANNATRPAGFKATTSGGVKEFSKKTRKAKDGATTWSRHYVLEYEGKIYDFDHASDVALPTARYFESQFKDTLSGVVRKETSSSYTVRVIDAAEYSSADDISRFDIRYKDESSFFDFYRSLPEENK